MTRAQKSVLDFIRAFVTEHGGVSPTYEEIGIAVGQKSKSSVHRLVKALVEQGLLREAGNGRHRTLTSVDVSDFERGRRFERERILGAVDKIGDARASAAARAVQ